MANQIRIKRRASTGASGAPSSLKNAELAYNEADNILYYGYGDDGSGNATSIIGIAGSGSNVTITGTQTVSGDKTFSGTVDLTGTFQINSTAVTATAVELNYTGDLGTFTGTTIADNLDVKAALQALETALEGANADAVDLRTMSGTADGDTNLGTFTGSTIADNETIKGALQDLEDEVENVRGDLQSVLGVSDEDTNLGTFTGSTIADNTSVKAALQALETELEDGSGSLTADDAGTADFASGTVTVSGGTGLSTTASLSTLTVNLDDTAVTANSYGAAATIPSFTVDAQGRLTAAADISISITHDQVSDFDTGVQQNRLDQLAQPTASVAMNNQLITGLADPVSDQDAVNKRYADALVTGLDVKDSVRVATTANITLSGTQTIDGITLVAGDRVLVKDQSTASQNGIYDVAAGAWSRSDDADNTPGGEVTSGMFTFVEEGSANADAGFVLQTTGTITLDTTALTFVQFSGAGQIVAGAGLSKTGNQLDVGTANTGRIVINANDIDLATHGTAGTYNGLTVDAYGRVSSFTSPTTLAGYSISDAQPLDATLTALAGVTTAGDKLIYATASDTFTTTDFTAFGRTLVDDADAATARTTLGLGTIATQDANNVAITGGSIDNIEIDGGSF
jgi:phage-related tail fiber protein